MPNRFLIVGAGGRECAFAKRLAEETTLFAVINHANPAIIHCVERSGGHYTVGDASNPETVLEFAQKHAIDYAFVNADEPLANGVVDRLLENNIRAIGGTREATRIEWDKVYCIEMMKKICPEVVPFFRVVSDQRKVAAAIKEFKSRQLSVVVKPQGLTGGKGVKVMPVHLATYEDCAEYASALFNARPEENVLLVEKLEGFEFTIMGFTDGKNLVLSPASYDFPYRYEGDIGPGTGGMGCFTNSGKKLPFMEEKDLQICQFIMQSVVDELRTRKLPFTGVLNGGFFKTPQGIRFMEFNGRFGDPEGLNILTILKSSFAELLISLWDQTLTEDKVRFSDLASVVKYLVASEYPEESPRATTFEVDEDGIERLGASLFFASCIKDQAGYKTLRKSRVLAVGATARTIEEASSIVNSAIDTCIKGDLEYRRDIGSEKNLEALRDIRNAPRK